MQYTSSRALLPLFSPTILDLLRDPFPGNNTSPWFTLPPGEPAFDPGRKYLYVQSGGDLCAGYSHHTFSLVCTIAEAMHLNRTLVLDGLFCSVAEQTESGRMRVRPMFSYIDLDHMRK